MHKMDVKFLDELERNKCFSELQSFTIIQLMKIIPCSYSKAYNSLNSLCVAEFVAKGMKNSRAETYYLTDKGIEKLKELREKVRG